MINDAFSGQDFIFLPGNRFNSTTNDSALIYYYNADADGGNGCFEKGRLWKNNILKSNEFAKGCPDVFFDLLWESMNCSDSWGIYRDNPEFLDIVTFCHDADFFGGQDGNSDDEIELLLNWSRC